MRKMQPLTLLICAIFFSVNILAQVGDSVTLRMAAGPQYAKPESYQKKWGHNNRTAWTTPIDFKVIRLDTLYGGLRAYKMGGGHQSKSLRLKNKSDQKYAMRSLKKTLRVIMPVMFQNTFLESLGDDEISMSHPYGALTVPPMAKAAGIYHTYPIYGYIPKQAALDTFQDFGNQLYLLEQRPDDDWSNAPNLGGFNKFWNSDEVREKIQEDNKREVDQLAFAKARLFDMFLGDWDRHEEQWKWGKVEKDKKTVYIPIPVDRDQVYSTFDGSLLRMAIKSANAQYFQPFDHDIAYPEGFSYERRNVDRYFTNHVTLDQWLAAAKELQASLTDNAIETGVKMFPPEIFAIDGNTIIEKLKSRRGHLQEIATKYYRFLAQTVDVVGSKDREYFEVKRLENGKTLVNVYDLKDGERRGKPYWTRTLNPSETKEVRLYGISGKDTYNVDGQSSGDVRIRIIGGDDKDSIVLGGYGRKVHIYDDRGENIIVGSGKKKHLSGDSLVHFFDYDNFRPEKKGIKPLIGYNDEDRLFVGLGYSWITQGFRKLPFASKQTLSANYSISQKAFSGIYKGIFTKFVDEWDLLLYGTYDAVRWNNFFGLGNETLNTFDSANFYQLRTQQAIVRAGFQRIAGKSNFTISGAYNSVEILSDPTRYYAKTYVRQHPKRAQTDYFLNASLNYNITAVNDSIVPERGVIFSANAGYTRNVKNDDKSFADFGAKLELFIPVVRTISFAISAAGSTVTGTPEFYQYRNVGGGNNLRGFKRERFYGKSAFYNSNELRYLGNMHTRLMNGKIGLVAFFDNGRVWMPEEKSNTWHTAYGGGILLAPFNMILFDVTYGISKEDKLIQLRVRKKL